MKFNLPSSAITQFRVCKCTAAVSSPAHRPSPIEGEDQTLPDFIENPSPHSDPPNFPQPGLSPGPEPGHNVKLNIMSIYYVINLA